MIEWVLAMSREDSMESKSALLNILYDTKNSSEEMRETLSLFFQSINQSWSKDLVENIFLEFCEFIGNNDSYLCQGCDITETNQECSRVVDLSSFYNRYIDDRHYAWGIIYPGQELEPYQIDILEENEISTRNNQEMIRGKKPIAWVTKTAALQEIIEPLQKEDWASAIRSQLGLNHDRGHDVVYIEIKYHMETLGTIRLRSPTFLDGYSGLGNLHEPVYRSYNAEDSWGRTVNLETFENGLPEAVHSPIKFGEGFSLRYVGKAYKSDQVLNKDKLLNSFNPPWYNNLSEDLIQVINHDFQIRTGE